jgi:Protein of unknown function (DUF2934)
MSQEQRPLYGELVIPFNAEDKSETHAKARTRSDQLRTMNRGVASFLAERRGFISGHKLEDWLKEEMEILRNMK